MLQILTISFGTLVLFTASSLGRDLHVNNLMGDDHNNGRASEFTSGNNGPTRTIARALQIADYTDRVIIADSGEPYRECLSLTGKRHSGSSRNPFIIEGNGATLDGTILIPNDQWRAGADDVFVVSPRRQSFQQIFLDGKPAKRVELFHATDFKKLKPLQYGQYRHELFFRVEKEKIADDYELTYSQHPVGITLYQVDHVLIRDLTIQGFQLDGINAIDDAFDCVVEAVTTRGNGRSGISVGGASTVVVESCTSGDNVVAQIRTEGWSTTKVVRCDLIDNDGPAWKMEGGQLQIDGKTMNRPATLQSRIPLHRP